MKIEQIGENMQNKKNSFDCIVIMGITKESIIVEFVVDPRILTKTEEKAIS